MTYGIASLVFIPLLAIAMAHTMWAVGINWPTGDARTLALAVVGTRNVEKMPPRPMSLAVALFALASGIWALYLTDPDPSIVLTLGGAALAAIFLGRGGVGYTAKWRSLTPEEPFATFDRRVYSPLCLFIGLGFALLTYWRF